MTNEALPCRLSFSVWHWHIHESKAGQPRRATLGGWLACSGRESGETLDAGWGIWWASLWVHTRSKEIWGTLEQLHLSQNLSHVFGFGGKHFNTPNWFLWLLQRYPWLHWSRFLWCFWFFIDGDSETANRKEWMRSGIICSAPDHELFYKAAWHIFNNLQ